MKVDIHFLESQNQRLISDGFKCVMHKGSFTQEVVLAKIKKNSGHFVRVPTKTTCNIISEQATVVEKLESFLLRDSQTDQTIAIGNIVKYKPLVLPKYDSLGSLIDPKALREQAREEYAKSDLKKRVLLFSSKRVSKILRQQERKAYESSDLRKKLLTTLEKVKDMQIDQGSSIKESLELLSKCKKEGKKLKTFAQA